MIAVGVQVFQPPAEPSRGTRGVASCIPYDLFFGSKSDISRGECKLAGSTGLRGAGAAFEIRCTVLHTRDRRSVECKV